MAELPHLNTHNLDKFIFDYFNHKYPDEMEEVMADYEKKHSSKIMPEDLFMGSDC